MLERSVLAAQKLEEQKLSGDTQSRKSQTSDTYVAFEKEDNRSTGQAPSSAEASNADVVTAPKKKTNAYMLEKELAKVESDIARYEATVKMYTVQLQDPSIQGSMSDYERLSEELALTTNKLEALYERWETLSEEA